MLPYTGTRGVIRDLDLTEIFHNVAYELAPSPGALDPADEREVDPSSLSIWARPVPADADKPVILELEQGKRIKCAPHGEREGYLVPLGELSDI